MARQIIWTKRAQKERTDILKFWKEHNQSITFSRKLNDLIKDSLTLISCHPFIGKPSVKENVRIKVLRNYANRNSCSVYLGQSTKSRKINCKIDLFRQSTQCQQSVEGVFQICSLVAIA
jgi:toxin YoeB